MQRTRLFVMKSHTEVNVFATHTATLHKCQRITSQFIHILLCLTLGILRHDLGKKGRGV